MNEFDVNGALSNELSDLARERELLNSDIYNSNLDFAKYIKAELQDELIKAENEKKRETEKPKKNSKFKNFLKRLINIC